MHEAKPNNTNFATYFKSSSHLSLITKTNMDYMACVPYSSDVESLMFVMICTRSDFLMLLAWLVDIWKTQRKNIGK